MPQPLLWCALCAGAVALLLHHTRLGLHLFAVGAQARSAQLNGVPVVAVTVSAYVACSLLAVVAGIYLAARVASGDPTMGASFGLESVTAVALGGVQLTGGVGSVLGVVTGAPSMMPRPNVLLAVKVDARRVGRGRASAVATRPRSTAATM